MSQYDDRTTARTSVSTRSGRGYSSNFDYERPGARREADYGDSYTDEGYSSDLTGSGSTVALPPPRGFEEELVEHRRLTWNAGTDLGLLVMRLVLGGILAGHGAQKVFGWFGGAGLDGFAAFLAGQGYDESDALSAAGGFAELVGGLLVILGVFTPLAAAGLLAVMINAIWLQWDSGLFVEEGGFELELALAGLAAGLVFTGPGRVALDNGRAWFRHPVATGWVCLVIGAGVGVGIYAFFHGI